jgi:membrane-bound serine protease (ClpP class)
MRSMRGSKLLSLRALAVCLWTALLVSFSSGHALAAGSYVHVRVDGVVNPIKARHVQRAVERAALEQARFLLVTIDTPGGLVSSMQEIVAALTNSRVPVVGFTAPRSAQATSAGAFILLAADLCAMSPGTRIGAAHPVADGKALDEALDKKATNSLVSLVKSLAQRRGRPPALAEAMVRDSVSYTAEEAHEKKLIELIAASEAELSQQLEGREVRPGVRLATRGLSRIDLPLSNVDRALDRIADPSITSLLISLGTLAILYELGTAGIGAGGAIGAVLLVLGLLGSSVLPIEASAIALFLIGIAALALETQLPTHGVLGGAGLIGILFGAALMVDPSDYFGGFKAANLFVLAPIVLLVGAGLLLLGRITRRALSAPFQTGSEALVGTKGIARARFGTNRPESSGQVMVDGARWQAETEEPEIDDGDAIEVIRVLQRPMRLVVRRAK